MRIDVVKAALKLTPDQEKYSVSSNLRFGVCGHPLISLRDTEHSAIGPTEVQCPLWIRNGLNRFFVFVRRWR
jgi:hypothetical protein